MAGTYKEFRVRMRLRNNLLIERREELGLTAKAAAEQMGLTYSAYLYYEGMRASPVSAKTGKWKETALRVSRFYGVEPEALWPHAVLSVRTVKAEREVGGPELQRLTGGRRRLEEKVEG